MIKLGINLLLRGLKSALLIYAIVCLVLFFIQTRFIFIPTRTIYKTPAMLGLSAEEVWIPVKNWLGQTERIHGWWLLGKDPSLGTVLYFHGNGGTLGGIDQMDRLHDLGFSVLVISYRGYAKSEGGFPSESQVYADAEAAWNYLTNDRKIPPNQITIYGYSIGGAVAIDLATKHPDARALIVQSSFTSMKDMALRQKHFRLFPLELILTQRFNSIDKVRSLKVPVLYFHGDADSLVPPSMSQALYEATPTRKQLIFIRGAEHNDAEFSLEDLEAIRKFVQIVR
ncbi:alpha/beta fold hydrolase [Leptolyngbya sp. FACHB-17]|uniref:alpha/beta hydrolase n=1 Tax=unclassified Leptolyngbya TaxID=2650499 RepID=UPI0016811AC1|nr:alpha/beta fold hydrolase [Leptolyngbya sp. FACHB-17]MBD2080304.1 alpha/beta fold hydrolase [Leptolyngbya sp. FACHB-17]